MPWLSPGLYEIGKGLVKKKLLVRKLILECLKKVIVKVLNREYRLIKGLLMTQTKHDYKVEDEKI